MRAEVPKCARAAHPVCNSAHVAQLINKDMAGILKSQYLHDAIIES